MSHLDGPEFEGIFLPDGQRTVTSVTVEYEYGIGPVVAPVVPQPDLPICSCHERTTR